MTSVYETEKIYPRYLQQHRLMIVRVRHTAYKRSTNGKVSTR